MSNYYLVHRLESAVRAGPVSPSEYSDARLAAFESDSEEEISRTLSPRTPPPLLDDSGAPEVTRTPDTPSTLKTIDQSCTPPSLELTPSALPATAIAVNTSTSQLSNARPVVPLSLQRRIQSTAIRKENRGESIASTTESSLCGPASFWRSVCRPHQQEGPHERQEAPYQGQI